MHEYQNDNLIIYRLLKLDGIDPQTIRALYGAAEQVGMPLEDFILGKVMEFLATRSSVKYASSMEDIQKVCETEQGGLYRMTNKRNNKCFILKHHPPARFIPPAGTNLRRFPGNQNRTAGHRSL